MAERPGLGGENLHVRTLSHGRGGAGNIGKERRGSGTTAADLVTPTLKSDHYTTGRGGTGNMAKNDHSKPEIARAHQDVEQVVHTKNEPDNNIRFGRGGAANIARPNEDATRDGKQKTSAELQRQNKGGEDVRGLAEKGKGFLEKLAGKK